MLVGTGTQAVANPLALYILTNGQATPQQYENAVSEALAYGPLTRA